MKILIVDDIEETRFCLKKQLESAGHSVVGEAADLDATLRVYRETKPDFVLLDMTLEKQDGLTILEALRQLDPSAKVVVLSANEMASIQRAALQLGATGYLVKPVNEQKMLSLLSSK